MERQGRHDCMHAKRQYGTDLESLQSLDIYALGVDDRCYFDTEILPNQVRLEIPANQPWFSVAYHPFLACFVAINQCAGFYT